MEKKYWKGLEELRNDAEFVKQKNNEFQELLPIDEILHQKSTDITATNRRDFLKFMGFGIAAAALASCEAPVQKAIPYVVKPEEVTPGVAGYYASTFFDGYDYCPVVVKTREGRPIKIEGNTLSDMTAGGTSARVQASILSLYDSERLKEPIIDGEESSWSTVDRIVGGKLLEASKGKIRILSSTIISPSTKKVINDFITRYPNTKHITYDAVSSYAIAAAHRQSNGRAMIPTYNFDQADVIVGINCDFLTNWISPIEYSWKYIQNRKLNGKNNMSRHIQIESNFTVTGSNADERIRVDAADYGKVLLTLYSLITGGSPAPDFPEAAALQSVAAELMNARGRALVVCGTNDVAHQSVVNSINTALGAYGNTIDISQENYLRQGNDAEVAELLREMNAGEVSAIIFYNTNPAYTLPASMRFNEGMEKVPVRITFSERMDETAFMCNYICPDSHYLESWNDAMPKAGHLTLAQPTIAPIFKTRQAQDSLLKWSGSGINYHQYLQDQWKGRAGNGNFEQYWFKSLQDGVVNTELRNDTAATPMATADGLNQHITAINARGASEALQLIIYEKTALGNGNQANNPWLQELPDPVTKITWDNYLSISVKLAAERGLKEGNVVSVKANGTDVLAPVQIQPGQADHTVSLALGYGRTKAGKVADERGVNAYQLTGFVNGSIQYFIPSVEIAKTTKPDYPLAHTQTHHTMMQRPIAKEADLTAYRSDPRAGNPPVTIPVMVDGKMVDMKPKDVSLWESFPMPNHQWGMVVDLNSCIGCGACVVACNAENNVPVVGKEEVMRSREMHWMRIDRYYSSEAPRGDLDEAENPAENPKVIFQPMMCQHCNQAPCETVCPVAATTQSHDGLNQMAYNRCVGTRYCANNCPYKVRRFNWFQYAGNEKFDYTMNDELARMVLNPDVVVRSRGVMEKCTMCIQRIQDGKLTAKKEQRKLQDGDIITACAQACPTHAIIFGDYNLEGSRLSAAAKDPRVYQLLEELNTQPVVRYQTKIRNASEEIS
jgi:MoCo/4Fe-4S cofactor protein with predicted Tat translocation signal